MELKVKIDDRDLKEFSEAMREQVPYATAVALTRTAAQASDVVKQALPGYFVLRNKFTTNSIRFQRAEKRDWPAPKSLVGSIAPYMALQDEGGEKSPLSKAFAIPKDIRTDVKRLVPRSKWPGKLLGQTQATIPMGGRCKGATKGSRQKPQAFLLHERDGVGVYVRVGRGRKLKRLFRLTRQTMRIKGKHWLSTPVERVVNANLHNNFVAALEQAMRTRR